MSDLERIEARHSPAIDGQTCRVCDYSPEPPEPCDVVKLARALDKLYWHVNANTGAEPSVSLMWRTHDEARRTLHEVAGGDDD